MFVGKQRRADPVDLIGITSPFKYAWYFDEEDSWFKEELLADGEEKRLDLGTRKEMDDSYVEQNKI